MRISGLAAATWLALAACGPGSDGTTGTTVPTATPRTPVFLISLDTLRADHLTPYGYERPTSPALARFAEQAVRFDAAHAHATATLPSHLSLLTSLLPPQIGITRPGENDSQARTRLRLPATALTLAEVLREHGYRTAAFTDGGYVHPYYGLDQGFDVFQVTTPREGAYRNGFRKSLRRAADWLGEAPAVPPPFVFLHTYDVHEPYSPPRPFDRHFTDIDYRTFRERRGFDARPALLSARRGELTEQDLERVRGFYDNGVLATDTALGHFLLLLHKRGLYDDALIVVLSDHGEEFLDHGDFGHGPSVYQELARVPLLVKLPGGAGGGRVVERPVGLVDVAPTVLALLDLPVPEAFGGEDLRGLLRGHDDGAHLEARPIYVDVPDVEARVAALRRGPWKLVQRGDRHELYHLGRDPREQRDLAAREPERTRAMARELSRWTAELEQSGRQLGSWATPALEPHPQEQQEALRALGYLE